MANFDMSMLSRLMKGMKPSGGLTLNSTPEYPTDDPGPVALAEAARQAGVAGPMTPWETMKSKGFGEGLSALAGTDGFAETMAGLGGAMGSGGESQFLPQQAPLQINPSSGGMDASRMQAAQQMMSQLMAAKSGKGRRGLTLSGY